MEAEEADCIVPKRNDQAFRETYPLPQYHSERLVFRVVERIFHIVGFVASYSHLSQFQILRSFGNAYLHGVFSEVLGSRYKVCRWNLESVLDL